MTDAATSARDADVAKAVAFLRAGRLVALPTETVYGLGALARNVQAVSKIFTAKGRPADHPLIVHLPNASHLSRWARDVPPAATALAAAFWPGPLTLVLPRRDDVPAIITGGQDTVGLRVPAHPLALQVLRALDDGIAAPSANRFGHISPTTARHVHDELGDAVDFVLDGGPCAVGIESTIVDLSSGMPRILRPGHIGAVQIAAVVGPMFGSAPPDGANDQPMPRVSGSLEAHYAPSKPLKMLASSALDREVAQADRKGELVGVIARRPPNAQCGRCDWRQLPDQAAAYATGLYATLRALDAAACARILVEALPESDEWLAVHDRLRRAAHGAGR